MSPLSALARGLLPVCLAFATACTGSPSGPEAAVTGLETPPDPPAAEDREANQASECPTAPVLETRAPDVSPELDRADFWLRKLAPGAATTELLDADSRRRLAEQVAALPGGWRDVLDPAVAEPEHVAGELRERFDWLRGRVAEGKYVEGQAGALAAAQAIADAAAPIAGPDRAAGSLHFVVAETPLWCVPSNAGLYTEPVDPDFDRNRCASLHLGEAVRAIRRSDDARWTYVDAGHSVGWIEQDPAHLALSPALTAADLRRELDGDRVYLFADHQQLRAGSSFRRAEPDPASREPGDAQATPLLFLPSAQGMVRARLSPATRSGDAPLPFTREQLFTQAFAQLDDPYGWGGRDGHRDCSRFLLDLFAQFGLRLPRNSGVQAQLGTRSVDVSELDEAAKRQAIRQAADDGVVLLYMPGHIMLYLGEHQGHDYAISSLSEYLVPCPGGPDTVHELDRVAVTTLELGRGSERRAFIERITRLAVFE